VAARIDGDLGILVPASPGVAAALALAERLEGRGRG
jgi:hypothetical protein